MRETWGKEFVHVARCSWTIEQISLVVPKQEVMADMDEGS